MEQGLVLKAKDRTESCHHLLKYTLKESIKSQCQWLHDQTINRIVVIALPDDRQSAVPDRKLELQLRGAYGGLNKALRASAATGVRSSVVVDSTEDWSDLSPHENIIEVFVSEANLSVSYGICGVPTWLLCECSLRLLSMMLIQTGELGPAVFRFMHLQRSLHTLPAGAYRTSHVNPYESTKSA